MTYEQARQKIAECESVVNRLECQIPIELRRDKCGLNFSLQRVVSSDWKTAMVGFGASHGSYGCSSATDDMDQSLAEYVVLAMRDLEVSIIRRAQDIARADARAAAKDAAEAAKQVLEWANNNER